MSAAAASSGGCDTSADAAAAADVWWITGVPGSGKTFAGDYLASLRREEQRWIHVEGDEELSVHPNSPATAGLQTSFHGHWFDGDEAPEELWRPYYGQVCDRVRELLKLPKLPPVGHGADEAKAAANPAQLPPPTPSPSSSSPRVVVTLSLYRLEVREWVRRRLEPARVGFVCLHVPESEYVERMAAKLETFLKGTGTSLEEFWSSQGLEGRFGPCTAEGAVGRFYSSPEGGGRYLRGQLYGRHGDLLQWYLHLARLQHRTLRRLWKPMRH